MSLGAGLSLLKAVACLFAAVAVLIRLPRVARRRRVDFVWVGTVLAALAFSANGVMIPERTVDAWLGGENVFHLVHEEDVSVLVQDHVPAQQLALPGSMEDPGPLSLLQPQPRDVLTQPRRRRRDVDGLAVPTLHLQMKTFPGEMVRQLSQHIRVGTGNSSP